MITIIFVVLCLRAVFKLIFAVYFAFDLPKRAKAGSSIGSPKIVVIIKVYEEPNVDECVRFWNSIAARHAHIDVIVVGTDRERNAGRNPTLDLASSVSNTSRVVTLEAAGFGGDGAPAQVNTAIESIQADGETTWILLADVDSRYSDEALTELASLTRDGHELIQFNSFFLKNMDQLDWFQRGHALLQSRWTLSHERLRTLLYRHTGAVLTHVVGHGMCMRLDRLRALRGYANIGVAEDIEMGFRVCVRGIPIVNPRSFSNSDTPITLYEGLKQERSWSYGPMLYPFFMLRTWKSLGGLQRARSLIFFVQGVILYTNWLVSSWVLIAAFVYALFGNKFALLWLAIYSVEHAVCLFIIYRLKFASMGWLLASVPSLIVARFRHSTPADVGLIQFLVLRQFYRSKSTH